jgi:hypothetical protein
LNGLCGGTENVDYDIGVGEHGNVAAVDRMRSGAHALGDVFIVETSLEQAERRHKPKPRSCAIRPVLSDLAVSRIEVQSVW